MTTFHPDVPLDPQPQLEPAEPFIPNTTTPSSTSSSILIRVARSSDLNAITDILVRGFHPAGTLGWVYPLMRFGIQEDLRGRLRSKTTHQVCLVAYEPTLGERPSAGAAARFQREVLKQFPLEAMGDDFQRAEQLMGTVELSRRSPAFWQSSRPYAYISNLAVAEDYRRRGVAVQMLRACEKIASSWGVQELRLHVLENNPAARQLYAKLGYRRLNEDVSLSSWLLGKPRQMLLGKPLAAASEPPA